MNGKVDTQPRSVQTLLLSQQKRLRTLARDLGRIATDAAPTAEELLAAPLLDEWNFAPITLRGLRGVGSGHPRLPDGPIYTTELWFLDEDAGWARTLSRFYRLGSRLRMGSD